MSLRNPSLNRTEQKQSNLGKQRKNHNILILVSFHAFITRIYYQIFFISGRFWFLKSSPALNLTHLSYTTWCLSEKQYWRFFPWNLLIVHRTHIFIPSNINYTSIFIFIISVYIHIHIRWQKGLVGCWGSEMQGKRRTLLERFHWLVFVAFAFNFELSSVMDKSFFFFFFISIASSPIRGRSKMSFWCMVMIF